MEKSAWFHTTIGGPRAAPRSSVGLWISTPGVTSGSRDRAPRSAGGRLEIQALSDSSFQDQSHDTTVQIINSSSVRLCTRRLSGHLALRSTSDSGSELLPHEGDEHVVSERD